MECSGSGCSQGRGSAGGLWGAGSGGCGGCRMRRQKTCGFDGTGCSAFWGRVRVARKGVRARGMLHAPIVCLLAYVGLARISNSCSGKDCGCCLLRLLRHACLVSHHVAAPFQRRHNHRVGTPQTANAQVVRMPLALAFVRTSSGGGTGRGNNFRRLSGHRMFSNTAMAHVN